MPDERTARKLGGLVLWTRPAAGASYLRTLSILSALFALVWILASVSMALLAVSATLLAMHLERTTLRGEASAAIQRHTAAARSEGQRDAVAQVMSLQMAYERSRSVLEALGEGVLVVDDGGEIVLANPAARRAMLTPLQEPAGRILWDVLTPELAQQAREAWQALRSEEDTHGTGLPQIRYSSIPSRDNIFDLTAVEATSPRTGQDFGTVFLLVDSTRSHELQRLKDSFLSSVSHELRTPLTNVCAYAEILNSMMPGESAEWPEFVRVIHEEGLQLTRLVDGIFDFLQLESGEASFHNEELDGGAVLHSILEPLQAMAAARHIDLQVVEEGAPPRLCVDRRRLGQLMRHLLDNAIKFAPVGGSVRVTVGCRDDGWELRVEDSGPGVPPTDRTAVFDKFHQLPDHLTEKPTGTGLGLATSRAIVARFGGLIWCEGSTLGGSAFVVALPGTGQPRLAPIGATGGF